VRRLFVDVPLAIENVFREALPNLIVHWFGARELVQCLPQFLPPGRISFFAPGEPDDAKIRRHLPFLKKVVEGGNKLARGQITAGAEDDYGAGFGCFAFFVLRTAALLKNRHLVHAATMPHSGADFNCNEIPKRKRASAGETVEANADGNAI